MPTRHQGIERFRSTPRHVAVQVDEWRRGNVDGQMKRRQRVCKVCSLLKGDGERAAETSWHCSCCKRKGVPIYMYQRVRHVYANERMT
jgi:hypothetical protein